MCFGASSGQSQAQSTDFAMSNTIQQELQSVFGSDNKVFNSLFANLRPILRAGVNQEGFGGAEKTALGTQATEGTAQTYNKLASAVGSTLASQQGGIVPSGANANALAGIGTAAAQQESDLRNRNTIADFTVGRDNFFNAAHLLGGAPGVFDNLAGIQGAGNNANEIAGAQANTIANQSHSWLGALTAVAAAALGGQAPGGIGDNGGSSNPNLNPVSSFGGSSPGQISGFYGGATSASPSPMTVDSGIQFPQVLG